MSAENGIISRMELPAGYNIRVGKALWYSLCFFLQILSGFLSQYFIPGSPMISLIVYLLILPAWLLTVYYLFTFRDRMRWILLSFSLVVSLLIVEMTLRVWFDIKIA